MCHVCAVVYFSHVNNLDIDLIYGLFSFYFLRMIDLDILWIYINVGGYYSWLMDNLYTNLGNYLFILTI